jgi:nitrilase
VEQACQWIEQAAKKGAQCVVLPEEFATLALPSVVDKLALAEAYGHGPIQDALAKAARKNKVWLVGGTLPLQTDNPQKLFSSALTWDAEGHCVGRYDKMHLFDVQVAAGEVYQESLKVQPGNTLCVVDTPLGKIGVAICYDIRFPELFRAMSLAGAQILVLPSAFTINTGKVHWEVLLKARAIENLCYMVAPDQVGIRDSGHGTYGHSMIIDPWGEVLAHMDGHQGFILANIDLEKQRTLRQNFPVLDHTSAFAIQALINETKR